MFHMKHLFFLKRIITNKKNSGIGMIPEFLYRKEKKKDDGLVTLLESFIQLDRKVGADTLKYLHDNDEQDNSQ